MRTFLICFDPPAARDFAPRGGAIVSRVLFWIDRSCMQTDASRFPDFLILRVVRSLICLQARLRSRP